MTSLENNWKARSILKECSFIFKKVQVKSGAVIFGWERDKKFWINGELVYIPLLPLKFLSVEVTEVEISARVATNWNFSHPTITHLEDGDRPEAIFWLTAEAIALDKLKRVWPAQVFYSFKTTYQPNAFISKSTTGLIIGNAKELCTIADRCNNAVGSNVVRKVSDRANKMMVLPMHIAMQPDYIVDKYIRDLYNESDFRDAAKIKVDLAMSLKWSLLSFSDRQTLSLQGHDIEYRFMTIREICDLNDVPLPLWITHPEGYSILMTATYYKDCTVISTVGGKRMLGETSFDCIVRETQEETGIDLKSDRFEHVVFDEHQDGTEDVPHLSALHVFMLNTVE